MYSKVTTIIPVFNRPAIIRHAVQSVLKQSHRPIELILVDDGSTDDTPHVLSELQQQHPDVIKVLHQTNAGPGAARNTGRKAATGDFIQYLDSDDFLHPQKFEMQVHALNQTPEVGVCYCTTLRGNPASGIMKPWARTAENIDNIFPSFLPKRGWATLTPLWRKSVCDAIGPWKPYRVMEDWEHDLRAGIMGVKPVHVPEALCTVVDHDEHRASGMNEGFTTERIRDFFRAHESIWNLMKQQQLTDWGYVQPFSRTMFWIARMCGQRGLKPEAEAALVYTDEMAALNHQKATAGSFRVFKSLIGWKLAVPLSESLAGLARIVRRDQTGKSFR